MSEVIKIAISGKASSGKTTLAKALIRHFTRRGWATVHLPLAAPLKKACGEFWPETREVKDRDKLFALGQAVIDIDLMTFCNRLKWSMEKALDGMKNQKGVLIVVDDMRMPWEHEFFKEEKFICLRTECGHNERIQRYHKLYGTFPPEHVSMNPSECALDGAEFDMVLDTEHMSADVIVTTVLDRWLRKTVGYLI